MDLLTLILLLSFCAIFVGFFSGLFGIGGGIIMVPALFYLFSFLEYDEEISYKLSIATSLCVIIATCSRSAFQHFKLGSIETSLLYSWSIFIFMGAFTGAMLNRILPVEFLLAAFVIVISFAAYNLWQKKQFHMADMPPKSPFIYGPLGFMIGCLSTWIGIGGGTLSVPTLTAYGKKIHEAIGLAAAFGAIIAVASSLGNMISGLNIAGRPDYSIGYIHLPSALCLALVSTWFIPLGARLAHRLDPLVLSRSFSIFLVVNMLNMVRKILF